MTFEDLSKIAKFSKGQIVKNLLVIAFSFCLLFSGFNSLSTLQSTINKENGLGALSQGLIYVAFSVFSLFLPKYIIQKIGCKNTLLLSEICFLPWIASNFYPHWSTLIPTSLLSGMANAILWSSQCTYFNKASLLYCSLLESNSVEDTDSTASPASEKTEPVSLQRYTPKSPKENSRSISVAEKSEKLDTKYLSGTVPPNPMPRRPTKADISQRFAYHESINARFFGMHSLIFRMSDVWGNLLSFFVLKKNNGEVATTNSSSCSCGAYFCNDDLSPECLYEDMGGITDERRYVMTGICCAVTIFAIVLVIFGLDQIEATKEPVSFSADMVLATWKQCKKKQQIYLVPITLLTGLAQGFFMADVSQAYIGCALGTDYIGIVSMAFGASAAISSSLSGWVVKHIGRIPVFLTGVITAIGTALWSLVWDDLSFKEYEFYLMTFLWGVVVGTTWSQLPALYGVLFKEDQEAAFATMCIWRGVGFSAAFLYSAYLCTYIKIYILIAVASLSLVGYLMTEQDFVSMKKKIIENAKKDQKS